MENRATSDRNYPMKPAAIEKLNDIGFRLILIPFFGIVIPLITGMSKGLLLTHWQTKMSYGYTILLAFVIWQGNRYLLFTLRSYFDWFNKPVRKIVALLLAISFYTIPISALMLTGWYYLFKGGRVDWNIIALSVLIIMICVIFITHVYETVFLVRESENEMIRSEQLAKAKAVAELEALKNQIDPHFIFNSLNTLSHLIEDSPMKAKEFNDHMAEVYRYILQNKGKELVMLREEMYFLKDYFSLLRIRFGRAVEMNILFDEEVSDDYLVPPICLQELFENAIKHNEFSEDHPLVVDISMKEDELFVSNEIRRKNLRKPASGIGLANLRERYSLITGKSIGVQRDREFTVRLPVLKIG